MRSRRVLIVVLFLVVLFNVSQVGTSSVYSDTMDLRQEQSFQVAEETGVVEFTEHGSKTYLGNNKWRYRSSVGESNTWNGTHYLRYVYDLENKQVSIGKLTFTHGANGVISVSHSETGSMIGELKWYAQYYLSDQWNNFTFDNYEYLGATKNDENATVYQRWWSTNGELNVSYTYYYWNELKMQATATNWAAQTVPVRVLWAMTDIRLAGVEYSLIYDNGVAVGVKIGNAQTIYWHDVTESTPEININPVLDKENRRAAVVFGNMSSTLAQYETMDIDPTYTVTADNDDDVWRDPYGTPSHQTGLTQIYFTNDTDPSTVADIGQLRVALAIGQNATINSAYLSGYETSDQATATHDCFRIDQANCEDLEASSSMPNHDMTPIVHWDSDGGINEWSPDIDIKEIVQEQVYLSGWSSGNYLGLAFRTPIGAATGYHGFEDYQAAAANHAYIEIEFTVKEYEYNYVDMITTLHDTQDVGTHSSFAEMQDKDGVYDTLTEEYTQVSFLGAGDGSAGVGTTITPSYPSTPESGDLFLCHIHILSLTVDIISVTDFTLLFGPYTQSGASDRVYVYYRYSTGDETGTITITMDTGNIGRFARIYSFSNVDPSIGSAYENVTWDDQGNSNTVYDQAVETTGTLGLAINLVSVGEDSGTYTDFTGETGGDWTEAVAQFSHSAGLDGTLQLQTATMATAGTIDGGSYSIGSTEPVGVLGLALVPVATGYDLDLEVGWVTADYDKTNEELCIFGGTQGSEALRVDVWDGSWTNVFTDIAAGWNNISVTSYLTDATFEIRFTDTTNESVEADTWQIEAVLLHTWSAAGNEYVEYVFETIPLSDSSAVSMGASETVNEVIPVSDTSIDSVGFGLVVTELIGFYDSVVVAMDAVLTIMEQINFAETVSVGASFVLTVLEVLGLAASVVASRGTQVTVFENIGLYDSITATQQIQFYIYETIGLSVLTTVAGSYQNTVFESISLLDLTVVSATYPITVFESIGLIETISTTQQIQVYIYETIGLTDLTTVAASYQNTVFETIGFTDLIAASRGLSITVFEIIGLLELTATSQLTHYYVYEIIGFIESTGVIGGVAATPTTGSMFYQLFFSLDMWGYIGPLALVIIGYLVASKDKNLGIIMFVLESLVIANYLTLVAETPDYWWHIFILLIGCMSTLMYSIKDR